MIRVSEELFDKAIVMEKDIRKEWILNMFISESMKILSDLASDNGEDTEWYDDKIDYYESQMLDAELRSCV